MNSNNLQTSYADGPLAIASVTRLLLLPFSLSFSSAVSDTALSDCLTPDASVRSPADLIPNPDDPDDPDPVAVMASGLSLSAGL